MKPTNTGKTVQRRLSPTEPMPATVKAEMAALQDGPVDFSDIPPQNIDETWYMPGSIVPSENKQQITLRLDSDVLAFFRQSGRRYQSRINGVLREYMKAQLKG